MRAVIVGGGLGGLATALRLQSRGWQVSVCEAGPRMGGKMNTLETQGYRFDTGPSLITLPRQFADLFSSLGERMEDHLSLLRIDPHADYRFADGTSLRRAADPETWLANIRAVDARDAAAFRTFVELGRRLYELSCGTFFKRPVLARPGLRDLLVLRHLPLRNAWGNYAAAVRSLFQSTFLRQIFLRYPTYVGSSPYQSPATLLVIPYLEHTFGAWYVKGGLYRIVSSLVELAHSRGIELRASSRVTEIECAGDRVKGVRLEDGTSLPAEAVIMNGDAATAPALLGKAIRIDDTARSLSGMVLLIGTPHRPAGLSHHSVFFSADYDKEFDDLFRRRTFPEDPTLYVAAPAISDTSVAPPGGDALFVMANAPAGPASAWSPQTVQTVSGRMLQALAGQGISPQAEVLDVWHPGRFEKEYLAPGGAIYGTNSHGWRRAFLRPPNRSTSLRGLYFVGGSSHPGGGTPTVLMSAAITSGLIRDDYGV